MKQLIKLVFSFSMLSSIFFFNACKKSDSINPTENQPSTTSITGRVMDENKAPVTGATVKVGSKTATTDGMGLFSITDISSSSESQVVTVESEGYFKSIKTYNAKKVASANLVFQLLPKDTDPQDVEASTGGAAIFSDGVKVTLQASGVVNATTNLPYTGTVTVSETYLDPTAPNINDIMPGQLIGNNASGNQTGLKSFGMIAVEMTGSDGSLLQIAPGKTAQISVPIPASLTSGAPATMPLWYFDESLGVWVEQGIATKQGNSYVGNVSHFSFWNCDQPMQIVNLDVTIVDSAGPVSGVQVFLQSGCDSAGASGYTDINGYVIGAVPFNCPLILKVIGSCGTVIYQTTVPASTTDIHLGTIQVNGSNAGLSSISVHGRVVDCNGAPISGAAVQIMFFGQNASPVVVLTNSNGIYNASLSACSNGTSQIMVIASNSQTNTNSGPLFFTITGTNFNVPDITVPCQAVVETISYAIAGVGTKTFTSPADYVSMMNDSTGVIIVYANSSVDSSLIQIHFTSSGIAAGSSQSLQVFYPNPNPDGSYGNVSATVNITEYGNIGGFIAGNFSGTATGLSSPFTVRTISGSFRVVRRW